MGVGVGVSVLGSYLWVCTKGLTSREGGGASLGTFVSRVCACVSQGGCLKGSSREREDQARAGTRYGYGPVTARSCAKAQLPWHAALSLKIGCAESRS